MVICKVLKQVLLVGLFSEHGCLWHVFWWELFFFPILFLFYFLSYNLGLSSLCLTSSLSSTQLLGYSEKSMQFRIMIFLSLIIIHFL